MDFCKLNFRTIEWLFFFTAAISVVLIIWQYWGMNQTVDIYPAPDAIISAGGDIINGGHSESTLVDTDDAAKLHCQIIPSNTFAFCTLNISIATNSSNGIDLSQFDHLSLWLEHQSSSQDTLLIYLVNREVNRSLSNVIHNKSNMQVILPSSTSSLYRLPLSNFSVPSWWILQNKATGTKAQSNLSNVTSLSIATGDSHLKRSVDITLYKAQLSGKWLSSHVLYLALLICWITMIFMLASYRLYQLNTNINLKHKQTEELTEINHLLRIEKDKFETLAKTDLLTGIANRAGTRDILQKLQNSPDDTCSLIMFDIDHFKKINDSYGHKVGDEALCNLAQLIKKTIRETDHFARWGGEEFLILCPNATSKSAMTIANNLRIKVSEADLIPQQTITCSFGVAESKMKGQHSITALFEGADLAMYNAKKHGRNRVEVQYEI
jgi:diguanylate cyclase (GGDEF)-like protein